MAGYFSDLGYTVFEAENGKVGLDLFRELHPDLVFTDLRMPVMDGFAVIEGIAQESPETPIIVISGTGIITDAIRAMKLGARDYVVKPIHDFEELVLVVKRVLHEKALHQVVESLKTSLLDVGDNRHPAFSGITTSDPALLAILKYLEALAVTTEPILVEGETGTGKELIARAIHQASLRKGSFVAVNVAGLDNQLFSDTLFGHVRGAFTGADKPREGLVAQARYGTLFLDEIGDLGTSSQVKLLRLLQEGEYYPIGSDLPRYSDARIVVATHCNLAQLVKTKEFRQDLY
jgi:DNA-binding NtrC family response regulator